jgi:type II secretory pathway predicted ATPase ExeA/cell division septation protein DedD
MYKDYYRLQTDPFNTHPNTGTFFVSNTHKEAWYYLLFGIETQEPFLVLTGEYGMGKTLLCLRLVKYLKETGMTRVEYIPTANEGFGGILRRMATSLGIFPLPEDEEILQDMIYDRFRAEPVNTHFYLIIDDAHELDTTILTKLKYLSTFNHNEFFPVIMIFVGHPLFLQDLKSPALSSLNQRIKRRYHLAKFSLEDTKNYIYFRLLRSGATGIPAFPDETIAKIFEYSGGVPRLINNICDTCLLIGASKKLISIPTFVVDEARTLVEGSIGETKAEPPISSAPAVSTENPISFSEELPAGNIPQQPLPAMPQVAVEEYQTEPPAQPRKPAFLSGKQLVFALKVTAVVVLLLLLLAVIFQSLLSEGGIFSRLASFTLTAPALPPAEEAPLPAAGESNRAIPEIPTLREEMTDRPPAAAAIPPPPPRPEALSPPARDPAVLHPFSIRASSYQQMDQALKEMAEIRQLGLSPYLVKADLGDMGLLWRIYIGFFSTEEEARRTITTYKLPNAAVQKIDYACLVGEFPNESEFMNMFERLKKSGHSPYVIQKDRNLFRLYLGAYEKKSEAESLSQELQRRGINNQVTRR